MNKPTKSTTAYLLKCFDGLVNDGICNREALVAIRSLISRDGGPKVTEEDIFNFYNNLITIEEEVRDERQIDREDEIAFEIEERQRQYIKYWFQDIGVEVKEKP